MKHLPVPPLRQSLERHLAAFRPLADEDQQRRAERVVEQFAVTDGPVCQAELHRFAHREDMAGRNWLSRAWLSGYLSSREPLPLTSSVGFRIRWAESTVGVARAADVIHRVAAMHLAHLRGEIADEVSARGDTMDMSQWRVLAGGIRHPRPGEDVVREGGPEAARREIGVLWRGRFLMMPISDAAGQPLARPVLAQAVHRLRELRLPHDDTFTHPSYLGSDRASAHLDRLLEHPANAAIYARLVQAVFVVNLTDSPASEQDHQERVTFEPGQAWAYKPFTYQISLADDYVGVHVEHSIVDGVTLKSMVALVQDVQPADGEGGPHEGPPIPLEPLAWTMSEEFRSELARDIASYRERAHTHRVRIVQFPVPVPHGWPLRVSHDALQQFILLYAQLAAYSRVRSTYEAVDMREYQAGRTECLRPITADALTLARALLDERATPDHLYAALAAHRDQVIACKSGQGFSRHLLALHLHAERLGLQPEMFEHESYRALTTDFLSTTSVGGDRQIVRFTFAPTSIGGIGVNYTLAGDMYEFCLTHDTAHTERIDDFLDALGAGVSALGHLLAAVEIA